MYTAMAMRNHDFIDGVIDRDYEEVIDFCSQFVDNTMVIKVYEKAGPDLVLVAEYYVGYGWWYLNHPVE
jgi:hypothetical protein